MEETKKKIKVGYKCRCGNEKIAEVYGRANEVKTKKTCVKCRKKKRLQKKANKRGHNKNYYLNG